MQFAPLIENDSRQAMMAFDGETDALGQSDPGNSSNWSFANHRFTGMNEK
jgi:hypothetical protein